MSRLCSVVTHTSFIRFITFMSRVYSFISAIPILKPNRFLFWDVHALCNDAKLFVFLYCCVNFKGSKYRLLIVRLFT